ncbi:GPI ethanolamine phosphate transferase 1 [Drosophila rhopaloa]|uniref:GPI ethanolamine phosphate transferase 1 n=1 Tax=Drosophila rhopaloa TaxID=1041015 RepID=A0A6P4EYW0_DRORH|nr:GPI ethanolamine phosphate transferase 1 [Drosophila rhopaloa]
MCYIVVFLLCRRLKYRLVKIVKNLIKMWKAQAVVVHLLLIACLWRIYNQTGPLDHLEPQKTLSEMGLPQPADRLVIFLVEGLRADTLFSHNCSRASYLRDIVMRDGVVGISKASVPTLTTSAQVALFAGFNGVPPLLPTDKFDTIFNRTLGSDEGTVLSFTNITDLRARLMNNACLTMLKNRTRVVIFVYMGDVGGASPLDLEYQKKLHNAQRSIRDAYDLIEGKFNDWKTAYLLTSAHGLSNFGSHGGGSDEERNTPFFLWGVGINRMATNVSHNLVVNNSSGSLPLHKLDQIQLAPLMSALIGLPPPVNNLAKLPLEYIKVSREYERKAMHLNALQLLAQAKAIIRRHELGVFHKWLPKSKDLDLQRIAHYQNQMNHLGDMGWRGKAMETSILAIEVAQEALKFYYGYYHIPLVVTTVLALLGWQLYLTVKISQNSRDSKDQRRGYFTWSTIVLASLGLLLGQLVFLQWAPFLTVICLVVPFGIWCMTLAECPLKDNWIFEPLAHLRWVLAPAAMIVLALYCRCPCTLTYAVCVIFYNRRGWVHPSAKFLAWLALVILLCGFLWSQKGLQILMNTNYRVTLQAISMLLVIVRPLFCNENHKWSVWIINIGILVIGGIGIMLRKMGMPVPIYIMAANWTYLIYAFASLPYSGTSSPRSRLQLICFNLLTLHALLSDSYTSLFAQGLIIEYQMGIEVHKESRKAEEDDEVKEQRLLTPSKHVQMSYRFAVSILLYFYVSLLGTGHWMCSFTYSANTARLFLPDSWSGPMPLLVLIHLLIPSLIILSSLQALSSFGRQEIRSIFTCVMLICNIVVSFYVVFVPHHANWPTTHPSVINALLAQLTVVLLLICDTYVNFFFGGLNMIKIPAPKRSITEVQSQRSRSNSPTVNLSEV